MNSETDPSALPTLSKEEAIEKLNNYLKADNVIVYDNELSYMSWTDGYGSTAGPFGGVGGATVSSFTLEAWFYYAWAIIFCKGKIIAYSKKFNYMVEWR